MDEKIPSFKESLFGGSKELISDLAEIGIDSFLDDGLVKDIPVLQVIAAIINNS